MPHAMNDRLPPAADEPSELDDAGIFDWLRWWHWLILVGLLFSGLFYFPLWRFEQKWKTLKVGDTLDHVQQVLGEAQQNYTVYGAGPSGMYVSYTYSRYWRTYEVQVDPATERVTGLVDLQASAAAAAPARQVQQARDAAKKK